MSRAVHGAFAGIAGVLTAGALLLSLSGCARKAEVILHQPVAPPSQQNLRLAGDGAYQAAAGDRRSCLLTFGLPGSAAGARVFVLYLSTPAGQGTLGVSPEDPQAVRGFLIQEVGSLAGRTDLVGGRVRVQDVWLMPRFCRVDLDLRCEDGTQIEGRALVESVDPEVRAFERQYAADIQRLTPAGSQPAAGEATGRRGTSAP